MPRIRIRTPGEKRVVGTPNGSTLTVESVAIAQRASLQLPAEAKLTGGGTLLEHWVWEFAELDEHARMDLIAEPGDTFDPPAASGCASRPNRRPYRRNQMAQLQQVERGLAQLADRCISCGWSSRRSVADSAVATRWR